MAREVDGHILIGIFLEILAAALGTLSKQLIAVSEHLNRPVLFHIGASINIAVGPIVDASAYAFAPQVIVAPFACLDVIFNAMTAPYTLKWQNEVLTRYHFIGTGFVALGASLTSVFADVDNQIYDVYELEHQLLRPQSIIYFCLEGAGILFATWLLRKNLMSPVVRGISLGVIAGVLMGNVFFVKGIVSLVRHSISTGDTEAWTRLTPYVCIACAAGGAIVGHMFMRKGLGEYKGVFMVTIFEGAHISAACLSGCVVMAEMSGAVWWRYICYWASVMIIIAGMLSINTAAAQSQMDKDNAKGKRRPHHIASHWVAEEEEKQNFKSDMDLPPIGKTLDDQEDFLEVELGDFDLDGNVSPIGGSSDLKFARDAIKVAPGPPRPPEFPVNSAKLTECTLNSDGCTLEADPEAGDGELSTMTSSGNGCGDRELSSVVRERTPPVREKSPVVFSGIG